MLQRSFVLLVLVMLANVWTPPKPTTAQTKCPEGGCKLYLPFVAKPEYMRVTGWGWYAHFGRYIFCEDPTAQISLRNVSKEIVTGVQIRVEGALDDGTDVSFVGGRSDLLAFPGDIITIEYGIDKAPDPTGEDCSGTFDANISITDVTVGHNLREITVLSTQATLEYACYGRTEYRVTGEIRNDTPYTLANISVIFRSGGGDDVGLGGSEMDPLEPGAIAAYQGSSITYEDNLGQCQPVFGPPFSVVRAIGTKIP